MDDEALVVADCDTGIDDAIGLMYLTAQPRVQLLAVGSVHGATTAEQAAANTLAQLEHVERSDVPVAVGAAAPLETPVTSEDGEHRGPGDGLGGAAERPAGAVSSQSAVEQLVSLARARPGELTLLATGPLTNVALATAAEPQLPQLLHRLVWSGGVRPAGGEDAEQVAANANASADPEAAEQVLAAGYALTLVPAEAARCAGVDTGWLEHVAADRGKRAQRAADLLEPYMRAFVLAGHEQAWLPDTVAAAVAACPRLAATRTEQVQIQHDGAHVDSEHTRGLLLGEHDAPASTVDTARAPVQVVSSVSADTLRARLSATLRERHASELSDPRDTGSTPNIARVNDYLLGGGANTPADRAAGEQMLQVFPRNVDWARHNRAFLARAVRTLTSDYGIDQFLDLGSGIPTVGNVHEIAQHANPHARVAYVDFDGVAVAHARHLLAENPYATATYGDVRQPEQVLAAPGVAGLLDFTRPVAVLAVAILDIIHLDDPAAVLGTYCAATVAGSPLVITNGAMLSLTDEEIATLTAQMQATSTPDLHWRTYEQVAAFFSGYRVLEPGVVPSGAWRPEEPTSDAEARNANSYGAVGFRIGTGEQAH